MRFHPRTHSTRLGRSILAVLDRALAGHRKRRRPGCRGIVLGTQSQCNQRKRIDFAAALQFLLALKAFEGVAAILIPHPACLLGFQIALGYQCLLNLLIPLRRWSHLPSPPGHCPPLPAALRGGRSGSRCLGMAPICRAGSGGRALAGRGGSGGGPMCCAGCNRSLGGNRPGRDRLGRGLCGRFCRRCRLRRRRRRRFLGLRLRWRRSGIRHYRYDGTRSPSHIWCSDSNRDPRSPGLSRGPRGSCITAWPAGIRRDSNWSRWWNWALRGAGRGTAPRHRASAWLAPSSHPRCC